MLEASSWEVLSGVGLGDLILGVDFPPLGRAEANFGDLLEKVGSQWERYDFLQTIPPTGRIDLRVPAQEYVRKWVEDIRWVGRPVKAVLGYCAGAVYAAAIADDVHHWQLTAPKVILFDPEDNAHIMVDEMCKEMYRRIDGFGRLLTAKETEDARDKVAELSESGSCDLFDLAVALASLYRETGSPAFSRLRLSDSRRNELVGLFESYMAWLSATAQINPGQVWKRSTAILSAEYVSVQKGYQTAPKKFHNIITVDGSHFDLLRSDCVAREVTDQMQVT